MSGPESDLVAGWLQAQQLDGPVADALKESVEEALAESVVLAFDIARRAVAGADAGHIELPLALLVQAAGEAERSMRLLRRWREERTA